MAIKFEDVKTKTFTAKQVNAAMIFCKYMTRVMSQHTAAENDEYFDGNVKKILEIYNILTDVGTVRRVQNGAAYLLAEDF